MGFLAQATPSPVPDLLRVLWPLLAAQWNGLPIAASIVLAIGGSLYFAVTHAGPVAAAVTTGSRPGWAARRRARRGLRPTPGPGGGGPRAARPPDPPGAGGR